MEVVKEFGYRDMKHIRYDCNDASLIKQRFRILNPETVDRLCKYLKRKNQVIDAIDCYDGQSGWEGTDFKIGNANLSFNGYCLRNSTVEYFLNKGQGPAWYNWYNGNGDPEFLPALKWARKNRDKYIGHFNLDYQPK